MRTEILTPRLMLRDVTEADAPRFVELDSDPGVMASLGPVPRAELVTIRERIRTVHVAWQSHAWQGIRLVMERGTGAFLGWVYVRPATASRVAVEMGWTRDDEVELGYRYHTSAWGRGVATEAATPLVNLALADAMISAIVAGAAPENTASLRVLEKLGLKRVGKVLLPEMTEPTIKLARVK